MNHQNYGKLFKLIRQQHHFSLRDFENIGVDHAALSRFENGSQSLDFSKLDKCLQEMHVTLREYEYLINDFSFDYDEEVFHAIEESMYAQELENLKEIEAYNLLQEQPLLAICAKACYTTLSSSDHMKLLLHFENISYWGYFDISLLFFTIWQIDVDFMTEMMDEFFLKSNPYFQIHQYRKLIIQVAGRAIIHLTDTGYKEEAKALLDKSFAIVGERDLFMKYLLFFAKGYFERLFEDEAAGLEQMKRIITSFRELKSEHLANYYETFLDR